MAELNLIIFHQPGRQQISDFVTIRELMRERAPEIDVFIIGPTTLLPLDFWQRRAELPTALFAASLDESGSARQRRTAHSCLLDQV